MLDTGADRCLFDDRLALALGVNPYEAGSTQRTTGIDGTEHVAVMPVELVFPDLDGASWTIMAQFMRLPDDVGGVLGHAGFLGRMRASFVRGEFFELSEIKPSEVARRL